MCWMTGCRPPAAVVTDGTAVPLTTPGRRPIFNGKLMEHVSDRRPRPAERYVLTIRMELIPVSAPMGMVSRSERLWRYLDEEIGDSATIAALNRNGFRVGRGDVADWGPVGDLLRKMTGKTLVRSSHMTIPGRSVAIPMKLNVGPESIFAFNSRGELRGRDYPAGDYVLMLTCRLNSDDPGDLLIQAAPMVRSASETRGFVQTDAGVHVRNARTQEPIEDLEFTVRVPQDSYLVIGPGVGTRRTTSPGHKFLITQKDGLRYETLLVIVPQVYAAELPREGV